MADDTVASLGFAVNSQPLDEAKAKLKDVSTQAKETGQAVDDFNQKASKAGTNLGNGPKQLAAGLSEAEQAAKLAGTSISVLESMAKRAGVSIGDMAARVAAARVGMAATATASAELGTALNVVAPAAKAAAEGIFAKTFAVTELHTALRAVSPVLNQFGGGMGTILSSATLVRGSLVLLGGVVAGELTIAFAKAADQITRNKQLFDAMTGSATSGSIALGKVKEITKSSGLEFDTMAGALQKAAQGQVQFASRTVVYANTADQAAKTIGKLTDGFGTLGRIMQLAGATGKEESEVFNTVGDSIRRTGGLTADAFQKIRDTSLPTARAISSAFGFKDIEEFQRQIERTPISLDELLRRLDEIKPKVDAAFNSGDRIKTFEQSTREMEAAWHLLLETLSQVGAFNVVVGAISAVTSVLTGASNAAKIFSAIMREVRAASGAAAQAASGGSPQLNGPSALEPFGGELSNGPVGNGFSGNAFPDEIQAGAFASGGSFVVGGAGGTDSQKVTFNATPGEVVTIATPDQAASGIASLTPATSGATDIEGLLKDQTKAIVDAINGLKTPSASTATAAVAAVAAVGAAAGGGTSAFGAGGSVGGGGGATNPFKKLEEEQKRAEQEYMARERELGGGGNTAGSGGFGGVSGLVGGQGVGIRGFLDGRGTSFPARTPTGEFAPFGAGPDKSGPNAGQIRIPQVEKNTGETNRRLNEANQSLDDVGRATASTTRGVESGARDTVEAIGESSSTIASAISSALSSMGQSLMDQGGGSSGGLGGGGSSGGGSSSDYTGGAGFLDSFGLPSGGGFGGSSGGSNSGFGGSGGGTGNPFGDLYDPSTGGFDASNFVESSGDFARGGSFVAGGDGGTDTTPIKFFATKGERITITPPGVKTPSSVRVSPSMLRPGDSSARPVQHVTTHNKSVTIQVQAGISADTILRSRAQIQRAMR